jgi:hypothetical protein
LQLAALTLAGEIVYVRLALVTVGVLLLSFAVFWYWMGSEQALPIGAAALLIALTLMFVHSTMELNYFTPRDPREPINQSPTAADMMNVKPYLEDQAARATGDRTTMPILIEKSVHPLASWYARDLRSIRWAESLPATLEEKALITAVKEGQTPPKGYVGQRFRISEQANLDGLTWSDWLKWYLKRYEIGIKSADMMEIWVKP